MAAFTRYSATLLTPDDKGDLIFTGLAGRIGRSIFSNGIQFDASWAINDCNVLRGGFLLNVESATKSTTLHAGYARYFTPPPLELVQSQTISKFAGTSNQSAVPQSSSVQQEHAHYFDAGMTEQFTSSFSMGVDGYYKISRNLIDEGQYQWNANLAV